jgi:hypothetical protein
MNGEARPHGESVTASKLRPLRTGHLYVLVHPSNPSLYKIGVTVVLPKKRLAQHNSQQKEYAGHIVKETGQKWELKTFIDVPDPYWAEVVFWGATGWSNIPYQRGIEVVELSWESVQAGLKAATNAGIRPQKNVPDHVLAYTSWMNKRLEGRGISLLGHVRSKFGRSDFRCSNGHQWRTVPNAVAEGEGCPKCGIGKADPARVRRASRAAILLLLVNPDDPSLVKILLTYSELNELRSEDVSPGWHVHRYRRVEEPDMAEALIWELLGCPSPPADRTINIDLRMAEQAFREVIYRMRGQIALRERAKQIVGPLG